jgi:hypothetical protein
MAQQHPQGDIILLVHQSSIILQDLDLLQFRAKLIYLLVVVEIEDSLFDGLHAGDSGK